MNPRLVCEVKCLMKWNLLACVIVAINHFLKSRLQSPTRVTLASVYMIGLGKKRWQGKIWRRKRKKFNKAYFPLSWLRLTFKDVNIWHDESSRVERQAMFLISQQWSKEIKWHMLCSILVFKTHTPKKKHSPVQLRQRQQSRPRVNSH